MVDYRQVLGRNVRMRRRELGLTQEALAARVGIDRTYVSGIERGRRNPSLGLILSLARSLSLSPNLLIDPTLASTEEIRQS
jgi:transcriptional regulator with XRE-family HTH domain